MDSIIGDFIVDGRRLRPSTQEYAELAFPKFILRLLQNKLIVSIQKSVGLPDIVYSYNPSIRFESWIMIYSDYESCLSISKKVSLKIFPSDNESSIMSRILGYIKVEFSGRGIPK